MKNRSVRKSLTATCLLVTSLSAAPAFAAWYINQDEGYYKPQEYHNERFGDFPPADIDQKLFAHLNAENKTEEIKPQTNNASLSSTSAQPVPGGNQQVLSPAQNYSEQHSQQPAFGSYNRGRNPTSPGMERHIKNRDAHLNRVRNNRSSSFSGPWNNSRSGFSGPWDNNGSNFSMPWGNNSGNNRGNNNGTNFSGPWNNSRSGFSGPWDNNGSNFSMPWGNNMGNNRGDNNGSSFSPFGKGSGWGW